MRLFNVFIIALTALMLFGATACENTDNTGETPQPANGESVVQTEIPVDVSAGNTDIDGQPVEPVEITEGDGEASDIEGTEDEVEIEGVEDEIDLSNLIETEALPERWPEYVPVMDGLECLQGVDALDVPEQSLIVAILAGDKTIPELAEFYLHLDGWVEDEELPVPPPDEFGFVGLFFRDDDKALRVEGGMFEDGRTGVNLIMFVGDIEQLLTEPPE